VLIDARITRFGAVLVAKPLKRGATMTAKGKRAISRTAEQANQLCLITDFDDSDEIVGAAGPKHLVARAGPGRVGGAREYAANLIRQYGAM